MKDTDRQLDALEHDLLELAAVEQDGVFARTRLDYQTLFQPEPEVTPVVRLSAARRWIGVAAAVALVVGAWGVMFTSKISEVRRSRMASDNRVVAARTDDSGGILGCLGGPCEPTGSQCRQHDYDSDGDVDLADFQTYQLAYAGPISGH